LVLGLAAPAVFADATLDGTATHSKTFGCGACHSAHNKESSDGGTGAPLWGRAASVLTALSTYTGLNTSRGTLTLAAPSGPSLICMSCHDGVSNTAGTGNVASKTESLGYVNTAIMHPISFDYGTFAASNTYFKAETDAEAGDIVLYGTADNKTMECGTCHDVHSTNTNDNALRGSDDVGDALCNDCHVG
jgi:predicted CXXCH cytochrome family protein